MSSKRPEPVRLPAVAVQLVLNERFRALPENMGTFRFPYEATDEHGDHWTVGTRDTTHIQIPKPTLSEAEQALVQAGDPSDHLYDTVCTMRAGIYLTRHAKKFLADSASSELSKLEDEIAETLGLVRAYEHQERIERLAYESLYSDCDPEDCPAYCYSLQGKLDAAQNKLAAQLASRADLAAKSRSEPHEWRFPLDLAGIRFLVEC